MRAGEKVFWKKKNSASKTTNPEFRGRLLKRIRQDSPSGDYKKHGESLWIPPTILVGKDLTPSDRHLPIKCVTASYDVERHRVAFDYRRFFQNVRDVLEGMRFPFLQSNKNIAGTSQSHRRRKYDVA